jgi:apolipoprotein N-acyltransferase
MARFARPALAVLLGALVPLSLAPFGYWPLGIVALGGWFVLLSGAGRSAWRIGWLFGVGKYAVGASWVYVSIHVYGDAPPPLAAFLVAVFVAVLALFPLANAWLFGRLATGRMLPDAALFTLLYAGFEWLLTWFLTGFPWLYAGYAHLGTPLAGWAPAGGVLLVGLAVALSASMTVAAFTLWRGRTRQATAPAGLVTALVLALAPWAAGAVLERVDWVTPVETGQAALAQGNVEQSVKWDPETAQAIVRTYMDLSEPHWGANLLVWPEAAITLFEHEAGAVLADLDRRGRAARTAVVLGLPHADYLPGEGWELHNAALALGTGSGRYFKRRLVPFGEYVPFEGLLRGLIAFFDLPMSRMSPGPWEQPLLDLAGRRAVMAICYEVVYPELVRAGPADVDLLLTLSNDTWFGASIGPLQHLQMAQMRALENGRYLLRATNNGVTAIVDAHGVVKARLPQFEAGVLRGEYRIMTGTTPYARFGQGPFALAAAGLALAVGLARRRTASGA